MSPTPAAKPDGPAGESDTADAKRQAKAGQRKRKTLAEKLEGRQNVLSGQGVAMVSDGDKHTVKSDIPGSGDGFAPGRLLFRVADEIVAAVEEFSGKLADTFVTKVKLASLELELSPSQEEIDRARERRLYFDLDDDEIEANTDTAIGIKLLTAALTDPDPAAGAALASSISTAAARSLRALTKTIETEEIEGLTVDGSRTVDREHAKELRKRLDDVTDTETSTGELYGVLRGADSSGTGTFAIETEETEDLPPLLTAPRRQPGVTIKGDLTAPARKQIREEGLWDRYVIGEVVIDREVTPRKTTTTVRLVGARHWPAMKNQVPDEENAE